MTIRVCHNKFNDFMKKLSKVVDVLFSVLGVIIPYGVFGFGIYSAIGIWFYNFEMLYGLSALLGIMLGVFLLIIRFIVFEKNDFVTINEKLKLFEWREDC